MYSKVFAGPVCFFLFIYLFAYFLCGGRSGSIMQNLGSAQKMYGSSGSAKADITIYFFAPGMR
jgi:hypothetical protein